MKQLIGLLLIFAGATISINAQTTAVPPLVDVPAAQRIVSAELDRLNTEMNDITSSGGKVDENMQNKHTLYKGVNDMLTSNAPGTTTFNVLAGNSNYLNLKADDEAYDDFENGNWDDHMAELIRILTK